MDTLLRIADVTRTVGLGRSAIYKQIREGDFPSPVRLGERAVAWRANEIQEWVRSRPSARVNGPRLVSRMRP